MMTEVVMMTVRVSLLGWRRVDVTTAVRRGEVFDFFLDDDALIQRGWRCSGWRRGATQRRSGMLTTADQLRADGVNTMTAWTARRFYVQMHAVTVSVYTFTSNQSTNDRSRTFPKGFARCGPLSALNTAKVLKSQGSVGKGLGRKLLDQSTPKTGATFCKEFSKQKSLYCQRTASPLQRKVTKNIRCNG